MGPSSSSDNSTRSITLFEAAVAVANPLAFDGPTGVLFEVVVFDWELVDTEFVEAC